MVNVIFWEDVTCKPVNLLRPSSTNFLFILTPACQWFCENFAECFSSHFKEHMAKNSSSEEVQVFIGPLCPFSAHNNLQRLKIVTNRDRFHKC